MGLTKQTTPIMAYNWNIANDTYVPLPDSNSDANWQLLLIEWLEQYEDDWLYYNYFPYFMTPCGHC